MSWKATAWAKDTTGHRSHCEKLLLMILADYHDLERNIAWPSQATLAEKCEMSVRNVQRCLTHLAEVGFQTVLQKGNQYQPTIYRLHFDVSQAQSYEPDIRGHDKLADASEPAISDVANPTSLTSEPDICVGTSLQEPPIEPPLTTSGKNGKNPAWLEILSEDPRWVEPKLRWVKDIEAKYGPHIDLTIEAHKCLDWLQTHPKGKKRPTIRNTWINWLDRGLRTDQADTRSPPNSARPGAGPKKSRQDVMTAFKTEVERAQSDSD